MGRPKWLAGKLAEDLKLKKGQIETLLGGMCDIDQRRVVENFRNRERKVRLLVCSDVTSECTNLHYRCHRLIHYDMPWSLMAFQQRNGRTDRFGQKEKPEIVYSVSKGRNETIRDERAYKNIGDPSAIRTGPPRSHAPDCDRRRVRSRVQPEGPLFTVPPWPQVEHYDVPGLCPAAVDVRGSLAHRLGHPPAAAPREGPDAAVPARTRAQCARRC